MLDAKRTMFCSPPPKGICSRISSPPTPHRGNQVTRKIYLITLRISPWLWFRDYRDDAIDLRGIADLGEPQFRYDTLDGDTDAMTTSNHTDRTHAHHRRPAEA